MDGWRPGAFRILAFWAGADEPQTRERRVAVGGLWGGGPSIFSDGHKSQRIWADGHLTPRAILLFLERSFEPPARLMLAQPERGGRRYCMRDKAYIVI